MVGGGGGSGVGGWFYSENVTVICVPKIDGKLVSSSVRTLRNSSPDNPLLTYG